MFDIKAILLATVAMVAAAEALAEREWPDRVFDCQVLTSTGSTGLVGLQSFSQEDAEEGVLGLPAITLLGARESTVRAVQCVEQGSGKSFADKNFQAWFDQLAR